MKTIKTNKTSPVFRRLGADIKPDQWQGQRVLDCADGPGSLSAELRGCGVDVTAVDPLDALGAAELRQRALAAMTSSPDIRPDFDLAACRQEHIEAL